jgi:cytochrome c556
MMRILFTTLLTGALVLATSATGAAGEFDDISQYRLPAADPRTAVPYSPEDKSYILGQMRLFLATSQRIVAAAAGDDKAEIAKAAAVLGAKHNGNDPSRPAGIRDRQPKDWNLLVADLRKQFDDLAAQAPGQPVGASLQQLSTTMQICTGCHQIYRIVDAPS